MIHFFPPTHSDEGGKEKDVPERVKILVDSFVAQFVQQFYKENESISPEREAQVKDQLKEAITTILQHTKQQISIDGLRKRLNNGEFDEQIFSSLKRSDSLNDLIKNDNHSFVNRLFCRCENEQALDFWFQQKAKFPVENGLAQAIRLRAHVCVFKKLEQEGCFQNIPEREKEIIIDQASIYLKDKPESLSFLKDALEKNNQPASRTILKVK